MHPGATVTGPARGLPGRGAIRCGAAASPGRTRQVSYRAAAHVAGTSAPPSSVTRAPKRSSAG